ncbi:MAG: fluoroquinolone transport system permease protein [Cellvibrionaceae bacterium]|jgi:fluoroquinolone transport system permease protein
MQLSKFVSTMGRNDARLIGRDQLLLGLIFYPIVMFLMIRFGLRPLTTWLQGTVGFDLTPYWAIGIAHIFAVLLPMFFGMISGMLLIEEQEDKTLTAMMVTPISLDRFVAYRAGAAGIAAFMSIFLALANNGIFEIGFFPLVGISLLGGLAAPFNALLFFAFATNRVQAFGMLKGLSTINTLPLIAWFIVEPSQYLFGLFPPYWAAKAAWSAMEGDASLIYLLPGAILYAVVLYLLVVRFRKKAYSGSI